MSIKAMTMVWENSRQSGSALVIMLCLADYADDNMVAWPAVSTIAKAARMQPRNVHKVLSKLVKDGEIVKHEKARRGVIKYKLTPVPQDIGQDAQPLSPRTDVQADTPAPQDTPPLSGGTGDPLSQGTDNPLLDPLVIPQREPAPKTSRPAVKPDKSAKKRKSRIPANWKLSDEDRRWAEDKAFEHGLVEENAIDWTLEAQKFKTYHEREQTLSSGWDKSWHTWVLNGIGYAKKNAKPGQSKKGGGFDDLARRLANEQSTHPR